ncbi:MAG: multidrug efflux RND transporter permease subunit [Verrucomicrobia bacterium]|nr:multidrug efflux RND transporter permease subunit [Verrucomicrobiota bacterium]MBI3871191.1 multidrug efflux RND transporter permease subunit [Verrucomicrobiota bacterium]
MSISEPFIRRPIATSLLMAAVVLLGLLGYCLLPISALPPVDFPTIQVAAQYPGASPDVMVSSVTTPLERQFGQISGLATMTSVSSFGNAGITLQFNLDRDIDAAGQDVQAAINAAGGVLPKMPTPPTYNKVNPADTPILTLQITSDTLPLEKVNDLADTILAQKLSEVTGVGLVTIEGNQKPAVRVRVNPVALAAQGLSLEDVRGALVQNNINAPKGSFDGRRQAYTINANDQMFSAAEFRNVIVSYKNGAPVRIADIGDVEDNVENVRLAGWVDQKPSVILDIQRQPGANIIETADRVKALLPRLRSAIPPSVRISILTDRTETIRASVRDVQFTLLLTVGLVVLVIFVFLRKFRATVITSVALPLTVIGSFGVMKLCGFSLDNLSLMALTISTGFVVDDAIVMIENIVRLIEAGEAPMAAALKGARQIGFTIVSLSLSLIAVFIPLLFMSGIVGRLFREFAITLTIAVVVSAIVSLTLTPMMCARLLKPQSQEKHGRFYLLTEGFFQWMLHAYDRSLRWVLRHQAFTLLVAVAAMVATVWLYVLVPKGLLPQQDTGLILGVTDAEASISFKAMAQRQREVAEIVRRDPDVVSVASFVGGGSVNPTVNSGRLYINLKPRRQRAANAAEIIERLRQATERIEGIALFMQAAQDVQIESRVSRTQYQYTLEDADSAELAEWSPRLLAALRARPELVDVASDQQSGGLQAHVEVDREQASRLNVLPQAIDDTLYDAFGQRQVSTIFTQLNQYRVILEVMPQFQATPGALEKLYVKSTTGQMVPLKALARVRVGTGPLAILHEGQFPAVTLSFNLRPGASLGEAVKAIQMAEKETGLPETVVARFSGSAEEFRASLKSEPFLILAAIVVIYIVLGVLYESYIHPITILSSLPSAGVGALLALFVCRESLGLIALIGIILLIGIVKKNAIMMVDFAIDAERNEGMKPEQSIYQACLLRFRPIMMTTMAALLGALPLALEEGTGSELRRPLGIAIVGGLLVSQFLTLYTTPVIYLYLDRLGNRFRRRAADAPSSPSLWEDASNPKAI